MTIPDYLLNHYKSVYGQDIEILEHSSGSTWNDGGNWYNTIIQTTDGIIQVHTPSDYNMSRVDITKMKATTKVVYVPAGV